jgi:hypothetical protein
VTWVKFLIMYVYVWSYNSVFIVLIRNYLYTPQVNLTIFCWFNFVKELFMLGGGGEGGIFMSQVNKRFPWMQPNNSYVVIIHFFAIKIM